jgi:Tfp pilus assembly protein PilO
MKTTLLITLFLSPIYLIFWIVRKLDNLETDKWRQEQLKKSFNKAKKEEK